MSNVNHPSHYGGGENIYEAIKIIEHYNLGFCDGNALKYIVRAGKKDPSKHIEDLEKARWYIDRLLTRLNIENDPNHEFQFHSICIDEGLKFDEETGMFEVGEMNVDFYKGKLKVYVNLEYVIIDCEYSASKLLDIINMFKNE